jgi:hypothetical protein
MKDEGGRMNFLQDSGRSFVLVAVVVVVVVDSFRSGRSLPLASRPPNR